MYFYKLIFSNNKILVFNFFFLNNFIYINILKKNFIFYIGYLNCFDICNFNIFFFINILKKINYKFYIFFISFDLKNDNFFILNNYNNILKIYFLRFLNNLFKNFFNLNFFFIIDIYLNLKFRKLKFSHFNYLYNIFYKKNVFLTINFKSNFFLFFIKKYFYKFLFSFNFYNFFLNLYFINLNF